MILIPIKPISVNQCWQGRRFATNKYKDFTKDMLRVMPNQIIVKGNIELKIKLNLKSLLRGDIDNFVKPIVDCVVKKGWIEDDRFIQNLEVEKMKSKVESIEIEIIKSIK